MQNAGNVSTAQIADHVGTYPAMNAITEATMMVAAVPLPKYPKMDDITAVMIKANDMTISRAIKNPRFSPFLFPQAAHHATMLQIPAIEA